MKSYLSTFGGGGGGGAPVGVSTRTRRRPLSNSPTRPAANRPGFFATLGRAARIGVDNVRNGIRTARQNLAAGFRQGRARALGTNAR